MVTVNVDIAARFQALPGPKPVLGLGCLGVAPPWAVVAEGVFDWLALAGWGVPACAALGTQGVERVADALRGCPRVFLAFDNDDAGLEAAERLAGLLGRRAAAVTLPQGVGDVGELAAHPHGRALFRVAPPWAVVAEGVFDWLALAGWGVPACAALGTQGVERVADALRGCPRVFLAFDNDDAGLEAAERLAGLLGRRAAAVTLPQGVGDVGELAAHPHGRALFLRLLARAARSAR